MQPIVVEKSKIYVLRDLIGYTPNSVIEKTIIRKVTGNICIMAFDTGESIPEKTSPFDTYIQIIEGIANVVIDNKSNLLKSGQAIIIPAHKKNKIEANKRFKMICVTIKSGYEGILM